MGPAFGDGVLFSKTEPFFKIFCPLLNLLDRSVGHATDEAGEADGDLGYVDDDAFDGAAEDNLGSESVEGHLIVGRVLIEVVVSGGCCGGLAIHDKEMILEGNNTIEVTAEEVGRGQVGSVIKFKLKTHLHRRLVVVEFESLGRIILELIYVPDNGSDEIIPIFSWVIRFPIGCSGEECL